MEDSLSKEIKLRSTGKPADIRPNTTGDLDTATFVKLPSRVSRTVKAVVNADYGNPSSNAPSNMSNITYGHASSSGSAGSAAGSGFGDVRDNVESMNRLAGIRPKAPRTRKNANDNGVTTDGDGSSLSVVGSTFSNNPSGTDDAAFQGASSLPPKPRPTKKKGGKKVASNITDLWQALHNFSATSSSRSLVEQAAQLNMNDDIHYVNIPDTKTSKQSSSSQTKESKAEMLFDKRATPSTSAVNAVGFEIPELPSGSLLTINILSTWGDPYYLGLMGIELFDSCGHLITLANPDAQIWADPANINVLPEYSNSEFSDPRTVDNLLDGVNQTCDDLHSWLAPFTHGRNHFVYINLDPDSPVTAGKTGPSRLTPSRNPSNASAGKVTISMIRIWNYNKSRIHSARGARYTEISLDDKIIFKGEIRRAIGSPNIADYEQCCECILFTNKARILALIEKYDPLSKLMTQHQIQQQVNKNLHSSEDEEILEMRRQLFQYPDFVGAATDDIGIANVRMAASSNPSNNMGNAVYRPGSVCMNIPEPDSLQSGSPNRDIAVNKALSRPATGKARAGTQSSNSRGIRDQTQEGERTPTRTFSQQLEDSRNGDSKWNDTSTNNSLRNHDHNSNVLRGLLSNDQLSANLNIQPASNRHSTLLRPSTAALARTQKAIKGRYIEIHLLSTWGDQEFVGITKLAGVDKELNDFLLPVPTVRYAYSLEQKGSRTLHTADLNVPPCTYEPTPTDAYMDPRSLVGGNVFTTDVSTMWQALVPTSSAQTLPVLALQFDLKQAKEFKGLRIHNFNSDSEEDTCKGVKHVRIYVDGVVHFNSVARKAPGAQNFDYAQFLPLVAMDNIPSTANSNSSLSKQQQRVRKSFHKVNLASSLDFGDLRVGEHNAIAESEDENDGDASARASGHRVAPASGRSSSMSNLLLGSPHKPVGQSNADSTSKASSSSNEKKSLLSASSDDEELTEATPRDHFRGHSSVKHQETPGRNANFCEDDLLVKSMDSLAELDLGYGSHHVSGRPNNPAMRRYDDHHNPLESDVNKGIMNHHSPGDIIFSLVPGPTGCDVIQQYETPVRN
jgi:hypothetical protein